MASDAPGALPSRGLWPGSGDDRSIADGRQNRHGPWCGFLAVADELKPESAAAMRQLRDLEIQVVMLTGDNRDTARTIAGCLLACMCTVYELDLTSQFSTIFLWGLYISVFILR